MRENIKTYNLCLLGFGNVNRTLLRLLASRDKELRERYGIGWQITGVASRRLGWIAEPGGLDVSELDGLFGAGNLARGKSGRLKDVRDWLQAAKADVLFEATPLNVESGQPAIEHLRAALEYGAHAITANKGPVVFAYEELSSLAGAKGKRFLFESTVMDGVPIFSLFRDSLPTVHLRGFRGILNSTTNVIISGMEEGLSFDQALQKAQELGVAETDATHDIDGWDAAVKVSALVTVLMGAHLRPGEVQREGIRNLSGEIVRSACSQGKRYKLVCRARRVDQRIEASVGPELLPVNDPLAQVAGTSSIVYFESDIFPGLVITEHNPGLEATAYGMLADFVRAVSR
ncbi:MAG: homoserine dehydrogenase [Acidobacteria bacterium]|nr:MAG: homoserine dehydrogenase [Acidobacteriota bacterium]